MINLFTLVVLCGVLVSAALHDWRTKQIPNYYPICAAGVAILRIMTGCITIPDAVIGLVLGTVAMLLLKFVRHSVGWGDVKLIAACGVALGSTGVIDLIVFSFLFNYAAYRLLRFRGKVDKNWATAFGPYIAAGFGGVLLINVIGVIVSGQI